MRKQLLIIVLLFFLPVSLSYGQVGNSGGFGANSINTTAPGLPNGSFQFDDNGTFKGGATTLQVSAFKGATVDAQIANCWAALPPSGGTCDDSNRTIAPLPFAQDVIVPSQNRLILGNLSYNTGDSRIIVSDKGWLVGSLNTDISGTVIGDGVVKTDLNGTSQHLVNLTIHNLDDTDTGSSSLDVEGGGNVMASNLTLGGGYYDLIIKSSYYNLFSHLRLQDGPQGQSIHYGGYLESANSNSFDHLVILSQGDGCLDVENSQGVSIHHYDCESVTQIGIAAGLSVPGNVTITIDGGYFQPATGAYLYDIGVDALSSSIITMGVFNFGYNSGCMGACSELMSIGGFGAPTNNGALSLGTTSFGTGDRELRLNASGFYLSDDSESVDWYLGYHFGNDFVIAVASPPTGFMAIPFQATSAGISLSGQIMSNGALGESKTLNLGSCSVVVTNGLITGGTC